MEIKKLVIYGKFLKRKKLKKIKRSHVISGTMVIFLMGMLVGYQNCSSKSSGASYQPTADQLAQSADLATLTNRMSDLQTLLSGMVDTETQNRLQSEQAITARIDGVSNDLSQFKTTTSSAISSLQTQTASLQSQLTSQGSDLNSKIASVQTDLDTFKVDSNNQLSLLNQTLTNSINTQVGVLQDQLYKNKQEILTQLQNASNLSNSQVQDLTNRTLQNENKILSLANAHEELKTQLATNYATKEDLNNLKSLYEDLSIVTTNLNLKIDLTKETIISQLGPQIDSLTEKVKNIETKVDDQGKSIQQLNSDLHSAVTDYKSEITKMTSSIQDSMEIGQEQMYQFIRENNKDLKKKFFREMQQQTLTLSLYTRKAVAAIAKRVDSLQNQIDTNQKLTAQEISDIKNCIATTKQEMADGLANEQAARQQLSDNLQQLTARVNLIQADLTKTQLLVAQNTEQILKLTVNFNQEKQNIEDRFQSERSLTDAKLSQLNTDFQAKLQSVADQAAQLVQNLGNDVQTNFKSVVTDIAILNSRQASLENGLKSFIEQYQSNRAKTLNLEVKLQKPKQQATDVIVSSMQTLTELQLNFIKILDPDEDHKEYYNETFADVAQKCVGNVKTSFPNALGLDSFQILSMEYVRLLLLGERTGNEEIDTIFHDYSDASTSSNLHRSIMLGLIRYPAGSDTDSCLKNIQDWARGVLLSDDNFKNRRKYLANNDDLERSIEKLFENLSDLEEPASQIERLLQSSLDGVLPLQPALDVIIAQTVLQLISNAQDTLYLSDRTATLENIANFSKTNKENSDEVNGIITQLKADLNSFKASTQQRLALLESTQGNMQTSLKRALDVLLSLSDRAGYTDLKAYTVWAGVPINYTPALVPGYNPSIQQVQHFFNGPLSLKDKSDACTGAKILTNGGIQSYYQFGQWGSCWVNFRNFPQTAWGNEIKTLWFRVFGAANIINIKVEPNLQATNNVYEYTNHTVAEWQKLWSGYNYDKYFDFRNITSTDPTLKLTGSFSSGVFDIQAPDAFDYYIKNIRQWAGIKFTFTPIKRLTLDGKDTDVIGKPTYYIIQIFSPLIIDMKNKGFPKTLSSTESNVVFDLAANGKPQRVGWVDGNEAGFLVLPNANGNITSGAQMFGEATTIKATGKKAQNGFEALAQYDSNHDSKIDKKDTIYSKLRVWFDKNRNGIADPSELKSLSQLKVSSINLNYQEVGEEHRMNNGNDLRYVSLSDKNVYDVYLGMTSD